MNDRSSRAWQRMLSGRRLDLLDPSAVDIELADIALGLSRVARWNGQTTGEHAFSVAQHSLLVTDLVTEDPLAGNPRFLLAALLHDASEYVTSDLITPFKAAVGPEYKKVEARLTQAVHVRFGLPGVLPVSWKRAIKRADKTAAYLEAILLAGFSERDGRRILGYRGDAPAVTLEPWPPEVAKAAFLDRFAAIGQEIDAADRKPRTARRA
ncbi:YfbR-like 5'-deoxynucleotidase [Oceanibacterium hippocampi]|uniref:HD/PDEase domain-containing protein n=1 Tax=Oceanibacterium hippocampi TaxID=745714 RepID=A0A1Y5U5M3_9PROT|nr:HD family hydrolase [Oceanibacterium hippocampi]SLN77689.1 hypothetical protein OCH7691_04506 [Oceanibacterium hippocampi]